MHSYGVTIVGALGRMGKEIQACVLEDERFHIAALLIEPGSALLDPIHHPETNNLYTDCFAQACQAAHLIIDFSAPSALHAVIEAAREHQLPVVCGTTALTPEQQRSLVELSRVVPVFYSPNMSLGIFVMLQLVERAAELLGGDYDLQVLDNHHRFKKDAPSGTALRILDALETALARRNPSDSNSNRTIPVLSVRGGDVVGDHHVLFQGLGDRLEVVHRATSRRTFALGALRAARWLVEQPNGLYGMEHLLA